MQVCNTLHNGWIVRKVRDGLDIHWSVVLACLFPNFFQGVVLPPGGEGIGTASEQEDPGAAAALGSQSSNSDS